MIKNKDEIIIGENGRVDKILSSILNISRNKVQELLNKNAITVNKEVIKKANYKLENGDIVNVDFQLIDNDKYLSSSIIPYEFNLDIKYEDEYFLIINKPSGMLTHPTQYNEQNTLVNACLYYFMQNNINQDPWIVHRLDKDTSGLIIVAKGLDVLNVLQSMFFERSVIKKYYALVNSCFNEKKIIIDVPIARSFQNKLKMNAIKGKNPKDAKTGVELIENFNNTALVSCELFTGRTHQIRVHLKYINHPIINDPLYGVCENSDYGQYLHSYFLSFTHPFSKKLIEINLDLPSEFKEKIKKLKF